MGLDNLDIGQDETIRHERPELPPLQDVARYYALAEEARVYAGGGPCRQRLAARLAGYVGEVHCVPVANGTLGLMVALREACGEPSGRRRLIAVASYASAASACAIRWAGFEPLFVDVEERSWQLDPDALASALAAHGDACAGILAGSTFGTAPPERIRARWRELAEGHALALVVDSGPGFGAVDDAGRRLGGCGDVEVFSFQASRPFAIGEGGAILAPTRERADRLQRLAGHGIDPATGACEVPGLNAGISELAAAAGLAMLDRFEDSLSRRRATAAQLRDVFAEHPVAYQGGSETSTWPSFQLLMPDPDARRRAIDAAGELNIEVRCGFDPPLHEQPAFAGAPRGDSLEVTGRLSARMLLLPVANSLGPRQVVRLAELLDAALGSG